MLLPRRKAGPLPPAPEYISEAHPPVTLCALRPETAHPPTLIESEEALKKTHQAVLSDEERQTQEVSREREVVVLGLLNVWHRPKTPPGDQRPPAVPCVFPLLQELCAQIVDPVFASAKPASRNKEALGKGSAFLYETSPYCSYAQREGVHVLFTGEVGAPGGRAEAGEYTYIPLSIYIAFAWGLACLRCCGRVQLLATALIISARSPCCRPARLPTTLRR